MSIETDCETCGRSGDDHTQMCREYGSLKDFISSERHRLNSGSLELHEFDERAKSFGVEAWKFPCVSR